MSLTALTDAAEIAAAYDRLSSLLRTGAEAFDRSVGWQGGGGDYTIYWHPTLPLWGLSDALSDHYWFGFGRNDPNDLKTFGSITAQISFWSEGSMKTRPGVFARDVHGAVHVLHSGGIGGGKSGIGKNAFLDWYAKRPGSTFYNVNWSKKIKVEYILLGGLDDPDLLVKFAAFTHDVEVFKSEVVTK